jgi:heavy-metal resistance protein CzcE
MIPTRAKLQYDYPDPRAARWRGIQLTFVLTKFWKMENAMKPKLVAPTVIAMTLGFVNLSASAFTPSSPMGEVAPLSAAKRTIQIDAKTRYVNVTANETVRFEANGHAFALRFRGSPATTFAFVPSVFDLSQVAPAGVLDHKVTAYVAPDPLYIP